MGGSRREACHHLTTTAVTPFQRMLAGGRISTSYTNFSLLASGLVLLHCNIATYALNSSTRTSTTPHVDASGTA